MPSSFFTRGGWWVLGQSVLLVALLTLGPWRSGDWSSRTGFWLGVMLLAAGAVFGIAGTRALGRNRTPYPRPLADAAGRWRTLNSCNTGSMRSWGILSTRV